MSLRAPAWIAVVPWLGAVACANVWGLQDLTGPDGGTVATPADDARSDDGGEDAEIDGADDSRDAVGDAQATGEGGEGGTRSDGGLAGDASLLDAGGKDAGSDAATCQSSVDCTFMSCPLPQTSCCTSGVCLCKTTVACL